MSSPLLHHSTSSNSHNWPLGGSLGRWGETAPDELPCCLEFQQPQNTSNYILFTLRKPSPPLTINRERGFLRVNRPCKLRTGINPVEHCWRLIENITWKNNQKLNELCLITITGKNNQKNGRMNYV